MVENQLRFTRESRRDSEGGASHTGRDRVRAAPAQIGWEWWVGSEGGLEW